MDKSIEAAFGDYRNINDYNILNKNELELMDNKDALYICKATIGLANSILYELDINSRTISYGIAVIPSSFSSVIFMKNINDITKSPRYLKILIKFYNYYMIEHLIIDSSNLDFSLESLSLSDFIRTYISCNNWPSIKESMRKPLLFNMEDTFRDRLLDKFDSLTDDNEFSVIQKKNRVGIRTGFEPIYKYDTEIINSLYGYDLEYYK